MIEAEAMPGEHCTSLCASHTAFKNICILGINIVLQKAR